MSVSTYHDYFGNQVTFYSMTLRHERLSIINRVTVRTKETPPTSGALDVTVAEARQHFASRLTDIFDYLQPTPAVPTGIPTMDWVRKFFPGDAPIGEAPGTTEPRHLRQVPVCAGINPQLDPARASLEAAGRRLPGLYACDARVLRTAGIPARYVYGYIESDSVNRGAHSGHALDCNRSDEQPIVRPAPCDDGLRT